LQGLSTGWLGESGTPEKSGIPQQLLRWSIGQDASFPNNDRAREEAQGKVHVVGDDGDSETSLVQCQDLVHERGYAMRIETRHRLIQYE